MGRETAGDFLRSAESLANPATLATPDREDADSKTDNSVTAGVLLRKTRLNPVSEHSVRTCESYAATMASELERGARTNATAFWQDLVGSHGFPGGLSEHKA